MKKFTLNRLAGLIIAGSSMAIANHAYAGGFMLQEQNAVQTGDFGAGGAAIAEDASTSFFNPAGLTRLQHPQIVASMNAIQFGTSFTGTTTYNNTALGGPASPEVQNVHNVNGGTFNWVPSFHASYPINDKLVGAFSVTTPFGLSTDYTGTDTFVQYAALDTQLRTIDLSPSLGIKLNNKFSIGLGFDAERLIANFSNQAATDPVTTPSENARSYSAAADWGFGWHGGTLWQPTEATRVGLAYHSQIVHHATGYSTFTGSLASASGDDPNGQFYSNNAKANVTMPASTTLSIYHDMNNRWALMGTVIYTQWNSFKNLNLQNVVDSTLNSDDSGLVPKILDVNIPQNFHNTWRASVGTNYKIDSQWLVRAGAGFDQTPTNSTDRNLRLPDGNRYALAAGAHYQITKMVGLDGGWTHEFIHGAPIHNTTVNDTQSVNVDGTSRSYADIIGMQLTWTFA